MKIEQLTVGFLQEHAYFIIDEETKHGFIVDPGSEARRILDKVENEGWIIEKILLTHGHIDHIGAVEEIRAALGCPVVCHENGKLYLGNADWNLSSMLGESQTIKEADEYLRHEDTIALAANPEVIFRMIHVPGHTMDGVAYYHEGDQVAIVGDILFKGSMGRTDMPGGNMGMLMKYIKERMFTLPEETVVYPGHGPSTTIGQEKLTNPYFNMYN